MKERFNATADLDAWERRIRNETREECAKVAEKCDDGSFNSLVIEHVAAAIRALKDKTYDR